MLIHESLVKISNASILYDCEVYSNALQSLLVTGKTQF